MGVTGIALPFLPHVKTEEELIRFAFNLKLSTYNKLFWYNPILVQIKNNGYRTWRVIYVSVCIPSEINNVFTGTKIFRTKFGPVYFQRMAYGHWDTREKLVWFWPNLRPFFAPPRQFYTVYENQQKFAFMGWKSRSNNSTNAQELWRHTHIY
jgi:hypothetical protein